MLKKEVLFGDRAFYKMVLAIAVPIMVQNGITNFVNLLDNVMVGMVGTDQMSAVAIVNQLIFVYSLCIFGGVSGAGIFTAQYYGQANHEGVRDTMRFKIIMVSIITLAAILIATFWGDKLISLYLQGEGTAESIAATAHYASQYLIIILCGLPFFMMTQAYASTLKECGQPLLPMKAGIIAVLVNLGLNYILIFGKLGFPALGVEGAAIATTASRVVELFIIIMGTHRHPQRNPFVKGLYRTLKVPRELIRRIMRKGMPLLVNETCWGAGMAMLTKCFSIRALYVVAALNICNTLANLFNIVLLAMGEAVAIIVGQLLGADKMEEARRTSTRIIVFSVLLSSVAVLLMIPTAFFFPQVYNTTAQIRELATVLIIITACYLPFNALLNALYFTLRSGGKTIIAFLFDSVFLWTVSVTLSYCLCKFTAIPVPWCYTIMLLADSIKITIGIILVKKGVWLQNIVD